MNTPRLITNGQGNTVWQWLQTEPFGNTLPNQDPNGTGNQFVFNLRFAGQYADIETGLFYNYFRDYDPVTGRYIQSDPLGLRGGSPSTYTYAANQPIRHTDRRGLTPIVVINNSDTTHAGLFVGNPNGPNNGNMVYDPGGSYTYKGIPPGEDYIFWGKDANYADYLGYEKSGGESVDVYKFNTTPEQEKQIKAAADAYKGAGPLYCAKSVREVLNGIGPFKNLGNGWLLPSVLGTMMWDLQHPGAYYPPTGPMP